MMYNKLYEEGAKILMKKYSKIQAYDIYGEFCNDYTKGDKAREYYSVLGDEDGMKKYCHEMNTEFVQFSSDLVKAVRQEHKKLKKR